MSRLPKRIEDELLSQNPELRAAGLRPTVVWSYDTESDEFREAIRRQIEAIRRSAEEDDVLRFIEETVDWPED